MESFQLIFYLGTKCGDPPRVISKNNKVSPYYSGKIDPIKGNVSLLQTGRTLSYVCPGLAGYPSPLPNANKANNACVRNNIRIIHVENTVNRTDEGYKKDATIITTSYYKISAFNYMTSNTKSTSGFLGRITSRFKGSQKDDSTNSTTKGTMTLMVLLTFSDDVTLQTVSIVPLSAQVSKHVQIRNFKCGCGKLYL